MNYKRIALVIALIALPTTADAAILRVSPVTPTACANGTFAVDVKLDTEGADINAIKLEMSFAAGALQVTDLSVSGSLFRFWAEGPEYSNSAGTILMTGGLPTPGFNGSNGQVARITLRPTASTGAALIILPSTQVLLNDGFGTAAPLGIVSMGSLTVTPASDPSCAAPTPTPAAPGIPGTPGPTPTPMVCPDVDVCHLPTDDGIQRMRECEVRVECLSAPSRVVKVLVLADEPTACPITARCAEDLEAGPVVQNAIDIISSIASDPMAAIRAAAWRGQLWAGILLGLLLAMLIYGLIWLMRRMLKKKERPSDPPVSPVK